MISQQPRPGGQSAFASLRDGLRPGFLRSRGIFGASRGRVEVRSLLGRDLARPVPGGKSYHAISV